MVIYKVTKITLKFLIFKVFIDIGQENICPSNLLSLLLIAYVVFEFITLNSGQLLYLKKILVLLM